MRPLGMSILCRSCAGTVWLYSIPPWTGPNAPPAGPLETRQTFVGPSGRTPDLDLGGILSMPELLAGTTYTMILEMTAGNGAWLSSPNAAFDDTTITPGANYVSRAARVTNRIGLPFEDVSTLNVPGAPFLYEISGTVAPVGPPVAPVPVPASLPILAMAIGALMASDAGRPGSPEPSRARQHTTRPQPTQDPFFQEVLSEEFSVMLDTNPRLGTPMPTTANTNGWDTVFGIKFADVNQAIINADSSPPDFDYPMDPQGEAIEGDYGDWQVTGGSGQLLHMTLPVPELTLTFEGETPVVRRQVSITIEVQLDQLPAGGRHARVSRGELVEFRLRGNNGPENSAVVVLSVSYPNLPPSPALPVSPPRAATV
jgi:hypothetical protein